MNDPLISYLSLGLICMLVLILHQRRHGLFSEVWIFIPGLLVRVVLTGVAEKVYRAPRKRSIEQLYAELGKVFAKVE
jgi:hypothetical protein